MADQEAEGSTHGGGCHNRKSGSQEIEELGSFYFADHLLYLSPHVGGSTKLTLTEVCWCLATKVTALSLQILAKANHGETFGLAW